MYICAAGGKRMKVNACLLCGVAFTLVKSQDFVAVGVENYSYPECIQLFAFVNYKHIDIEAHEVH
jgi:hypothetical protein